VYPVSHGIASRRFVCLEISVSAKEIVMTRASIRTLGIGVVVCVFLLLTIGGMSVASKTPEIMPFAQVTPGMKGVARTVVSGTTIEEFDIEVLGKFRSGENLQNMILVCASGPIIDNSRGIAAGMSGSPVYVDGKIIGGLAYKYDAAEGSLGLVTPIEDMLEIFGYDALTETLTPQDTLECPETDELRTGSEEGDNVQYHAITRQAFEPIASSVMVNGLRSERARRVFADTFQRLGIGPVRATGIASNDDEAVSIEPGSSIAVQLMRGDINAVALGTVTYRDGNRILAFGHPFMHKGHVGYLASGAYVYATVGSEMSSFKVGSSTSLIGTMTQDRMAGVSGVIGKFPRVFSVRLSVHAKDLDRTQEIFVQLVQDSSLIPGLLATVLLEGVDSTIDRIGPGTAYVSFEITGKGLKRPVKRENVFFSGYDIAVVSLSEIMEGINLILQNEFKDVEIIDLKVNMDIDRKCNKAVIENVSIENEVVRLGDVLRARVALRPFRGETCFKTIEIEIPHNMVPGYALLAVHGGNTYAVERSTDYDFYSYAGSNTTPGSNVDSLDSLVDTFVIRDMNNQLIVSVMPYASTYSTDSAQSSTASYHVENNVQLLANAAEVKEHKGKDSSNADLLPSIDDELRNDIRVVHTTDYVIEGWKDLEFQIVSTQGVEGLPMESEPLGLGVLQQVDEELE
jgi:hypothetical protein